MENVLVVKKAKLFERFKFEGFLHSKKFNFYKTILKNYEFKLRNEKLENDKRFKQIIPYQVLICNCHKKVFVYKRVKSKSEKRHLFKYSIGIGGHINLKSKDPIEKGRLKELEEEVSLPRIIKNKMVGYINLENSLFNSVHFGIVYFLLLKNEEVDIKEKINKKIGFFDYKKLKKLKNRMEDWSKLLIENFDELNFF